MRNSGNIVFGGVLLAIGVIWLLRSLNLFEFYWADLFGLWYWFLIAAGFLLLISGLSNNRLAGSLAGVLITLAIVGGVTKGAHREFRSLAPFEWQSRKWKDGKNSEERRESRRERRSRQKTGEVVKGNFGYDMQPGLTASKLNFAGGAGTFTIDGATQKLFEANTSSSFINYISNIRHNKADHFATVDFRMEDGDINLDEKNGDNRVNIQLNDSVRWEIDLKFGAGEGKFDFSRNIIEKLQMNTGAADVKLKLGSKATSSEVEIKAGVAAVEIQVPKSAAVEIRASGALNSTDFPGFVKTDGNRYRSPDYDESKNRIIINYKGGLSSLKIDTY